MQKQIIDNPHSLSFRWGYVVAPLIMTAVCFLIALGSVFFLPNPLAFRFDTSGSPLTSMNKYTFVALMIGAQALSTLAAIVIVQTVVKASKNFLKASAAPTDLGGFVSLLSNMVLLPQVVLVYLMLDAFIYAGWEVHILSFAVFTIVAVLIGTIILTVQFTRVISRAKHATGD